MVLGFLWRFLVGAYSDVVVMGNRIACVVRRAAAALIRAASRVSVPCTTAL